MMLGLSRLAARLAAVGVTTPAYEIACDTRAYLTARTAFLAKRGCGPAGWRPVDAALSQLTEQDYREALGYQVSR
jgi:hypothetical protein